LIRIIIVRLLNIVKSLLNLFLRLVIKFIKTFSFIFLFKKYYSYFKFIANYLKNFKYYYIYKYFLKSIAIFNILLSGFTIFILTDFQIENISLFPHNFDNKIIYLFNKVKKYIIDLFTIENIEKDEIPTMSKSLNTDSKVEDKIHKDFTFYLLSFIVFTIFSLTIYNNSDTIISFISDFIGGLPRRGGDDPDSFDNVEDITLTDNRSKINNNDNIPNIIITEPDVCKANDNIPSIYSVLSNKTLPGSFPDNSSTTILSTISDPKPNTVFYTTETGDKAKALENRLNELLGKK